MKKEISIIILALLCLIVESSPVNLGSLEFDKLDTDISDLKYESIDYDDQSAEKKKNEKVDTANKNLTTKGGKLQYSIEDLKKFFKALGLTDNGSFDDSEVYGSAEGVAVKAVGVKGNENRQYKKGTKTKGFHRVHHKDEYKKDKEFYEEDETNGVIKKVGAKGFGFDVNGGLGFDKGRFHHTHNKALFGKEGVSDQGKKQKDFEWYEDDSNE